MADLKIKELHKYYGGNHVVKGIDLDIPAGEFVVLVGQSGCGKSTLLRTIAGLEPVDKGTIEIAGHIVNDMAPKDRDIAMVFQNYALYPYMTVYDNIAFGLRMRKRPEAEIRLKVNRAAEMLSISHLLERYPRQMSGGQLQRVAIGRAIVRDARLYLFDEPLSNLDAQLRDEMRTEIKRLHQELGKTMIYVTHDQVEAMTLADRIVLMRGGLIEQQGTPLTLFEKPSTKYVAGFLGSPTMNFIPGKLDCSGPNLSIQLKDGLALPFPTVRSETLSSWHESPMLLGLRPEHMQTGASAGTVEIPVDVELVQPTGSRTYISFSLAGTNVIAEVGAHDVLHAGERVRLSLDMRRALLVDPATEKVLLPSGAVDRKLAA